MTRKMKDSGIDWIGEIPQDVDIISNKYLFKYIKGKNPKEFNSEKRGLPYIGASDLEKDGDIHDYENYSIEELPTVEKDETLILWDGARAGLIGIGHTGYIGSTIVKIIPRVDYIDKRYWYWYLKGFQPLLLDWVGGTTIPHMNRKFINEIKFINFPLSQQKSIADFLDKKTKEINNIISKTKKAIEEYKKYKQSLITETVTKGLDKNVEMKDSGIEWIGETPEHWDIIRPNRVCKILRGNSSFQKIDLESKGDYIALQYGRTYKVDIVDDSYRHYVDRSFYKSDQIVENGDTVLISTSETMEDLGHSCFYNRDDIGLLGGEQMCLKPNKDNVQGKFLYYATKYFHIELNQYATGLKVYRFRLDDLKKINMVLPPKDEQYKIISFLDEKLPLIDQIISTKEKLLIEMEAYKKSLIYETVTGKREVE